VSGARFILDTNIILLVLGGKLDPSALPKGEYSISFVTELELLGYPSLSASEIASIERYIHTTTTKNIIVSSTICRH